MTMNLYFIPTLLLAAASLACAAVLRRGVRREFPSVVPWLTVWGVLCAVPALMYLCLCFGGAEASLRLLEENGFESGWEMLAGAAGVLPGLMFDVLAERQEKHRGEPLPLGLSPMTIRVLLVAVLLLAIAIPYGLLFVRPTSESSSVSVIPAPSIPSEAQESPASPAD